jgi:hypothetical protein
MLQREVAALDGCTLFGYHVRDRSGLRHLPLQLRGGRLQVVDLPDAVERAGVAAGPERVVLGVDRDVCAG